MSAPAPNHGVSAALKSRYPQLALVTLLLAGYVFAIMAGLVGTPVGSANFSIVFVWIVWWAILILIAVPLLGRGWCSVCPIPAPGEWLQRKATLGPSGKKSRGLNLRWPRSLRNIWLQSAAFLALALFSVPLLTTPLVTGIVLAILLVVAIGLAVVFERRAFCRYVCPVGGFIGLYSQAAPLELRVKDKSVCMTCVGKPCYNGSDAGYGCPWGVFPAGLSKNTYCGLCLECLRTCPSDNIAVRPRAFGADLVTPSARLDEAFKSFVMLGSATSYSAVLLGPWGALTEAAYGVGTTPWAVYVVGFLAVVCVVLPATFALCVPRKGATRPWAHRLARFASTLIPLGLMAWIAFSLSFVLNNATYVAAALSDPLGLGWNLLGTAGLVWTPILSAMLAPAQTLALVGGLLWSARLARKVAANEGVSALPVILYCLLFTAGLMWLLL